MNLLNKRIDGITNDDIKRLIENGVSENKTLDYKKELKIDTGDDRKEFLYDITSLANTEGGSLIFGIEEAKDEKGQNTGLPCKITGIIIENQDKLLQRIEDLLKSNVQPQLNSFNVKILSVDSKFVLIINVSKFIGLPYMVTYNATNKFYKRNSSGKYLVDVFELNKLFMNNSSIKDIANKFRENRIAEVRELLFLPKLDIIGSYFLHIIPLNYLEENAIDITNQANLSFLQIELKPIRSFRWDYRHNLEGFMTFASNDATKIPFSYIQLFRNGILEFYTSQFHYPKENEPSKLDLAGEFFEIFSIQSIEKAFEIFKFYRLEPPYAVFISLFDLDEAVVYVQNMWKDKTNVIGNSRLLFPAVVFNDIDQDISKTMKSTFDILWQSGNYPKSPYYSDNNERMKKG